jgi:AbiV family abortive infection protein
LRSATEVFDSGDHATGVVLAIFGQEELGRSRILRRLAESAAAGENFSATDVQKACDEHLVKQREAVMAITLNDPGEPFDRLIRDTLTLTLGTEEYRQADARLQEALRAKGRRLPQERHEMRMSALYVDFDDDGVSWKRPSHFSRAKAYDVICGAVNDYAGQYDPGRIAIIEEGFPPMAAVRTAISHELNLPSPRWPTDLRAAQRTA